jgi:DNA-binding transcriptional LysR family regulator
MNLDHLQLFDRVAQLRSLSAAARERNVPVSQVSRALSRMESHYGVRLVHRNTHGLSLTPEGETFWRYCQKIGGALDELDGELSSHAGAVRGTVRLAVSQVMAIYNVVPSLPGLQAQYPDLHIDLQVADALVDMSREGIDMALRTGEPTSENLIARPIGTHGRRMYAAPQYLARHGTPQHPDDLAHHRLIGSTTSPQLNDWLFQIDGHVVTRTIHGQLQASSTAVMFSMLLAGMGICRAMDLIAQPFVARGELVPVLTEHVQVQAVPVYAVMMPERHRLPKVRACFDYWSAWFRAQSAQGAVTLPGKF